MEANGKSRIGSEVSSLLREPNIVAAPKDYFLGPIFAATPQTTSREVTVGDNRYLIGGFDPMGGTLHPPALDVRHARAVFALLSFRKVCDDPRLIRFSFNQLCLRYAESNGGRYAREIKKLVSDLMGSYIRITDIKTNISHEFRLIERIHVEKRPPRPCHMKLAMSGEQEMWFNGCTLSPEFAGLLSNFEDLRYLNLDVFNSITSPLAQAIYLYIPSRAHHHQSEAAPFEITLTNLLRQVSARIPGHASKRKELFTKNRRPILQQLDGLETSAGIFRVKLEATANKEDYKLLTWVEPREDKPALPYADSKLLEAYLESGRLREQFPLFSARPTPLSSYEIDLLAAAKVEFASNRPFFEQAKAILNEPQFDTLLAEAKNDELEGRKAKKNQTARLIHRIMEAISTPARAIAQIGNTCLDS